MSKADNLKDFLIDVADAIRAKKGSTALINPQDFSSEIASLSGGLEIVDMTETTATIEPNKVYVWGMVESLNITLGASTDENDFFAFRFRCSKPTMTVVNVNGATWAEDTELDAQGKPVLDLGSWYQCEIKGGTSALYVRLAHYIHFADSNVEAVLLAKGVGDGLGITYKDAARVTSISTWFKDNGVITSFDELKYFTNITTLGASTFQNCLNLEKVNLDNIVKLTGYDGAGAFYNSGIKEVSLLKLSVIENSYCCEFQNSLVERILSLGKITTIPNGSTNFGFCKNCTLLTYVNLPDTLTSIGNYAFNGCTSLTEITLPASLTSIGQDAFYGCTSLSSIVLPEGLTAIAQSAFAICSALSLVIDLPNLTRLGKDAFSLADVTRVVNLGKISSIEDAISGNYGMFRSNVNLTYVNLPDTLTSIGNYAFYGCTSLPEITLPAGVTSIGFSAFKGCSSLQYIRIEATTPPTLSATDAIPSTIGAIYVPDASVAAYQAATNWSSFASKIKGISEMPA